MKKYIISVLIITLLLGVFTGCGTTSKIVNDDSDGSGEVVLAPKSNAVNTSSIELTDSGWVAAGANTGVVGGTIRAFRNIPFSDSNLMGSTVVLAENGSFLIELDTTKYYESIYVVQLVSGMRESDPVILSKY